MDDTTENRGDPANRQEQLDSRSDATVTPDQQPNVAPPFAEQSAASDASDEDDGESDEDGEGDQN